MPTRPGRLHFGDIVGIVAPSSPPPDPKVIDRCVARLEMLGFKPKLAPNVRKRNGFLAGTDRERAGDLMRMFTDKKVRAIFSLRGGYGAARILPLLDYKVIRVNPKIFLGYSDITSLHCALLTQANLISFHGPTLSFHFGQARWSPRFSVRGDTLKRELQHFPPDEALPFTVQSLLRTLMNPQPPGSIWGSDNPKETKLVTRHLSPVTCLHSGKATGQLIGGNLSVLVTTLATPYRPSFKNAILFLEDIGEPPYRIDRMLTHLLNAGLLQQVAGIAIGLNKHCVDDKAKKAREFRQTIDDVFKERLLPLKIPVVTGLPFGHVEQNATLPMGARVTLDADNGDLRVIQSVVV